MRDCHACKCSIFVILLNLAFLCKAFAFSSNSIEGRWGVTEVHTNTEASRTSLYVWNDPRLVGRIFTFSPGQILNDTAENGDCLSPQFEVTSTDPSELIKKSMASYGYPAMQASAAAYRLSIGRGGGVTTVKIYCRRILWNDGLGADRGERGSWVIFLDANHILLRWYDETILALSRMSDDQNPKPSFDCRKSIIPTEIEICHSIELSNFDRSVSDLYKLSLSQYLDSGKDSSLIKRDQFHWISARNKCGANPECIATSMRKRLDELSEAIQ